MSPTSAIADLRPRRSVLYIPASKDRAVDKARGLGADVIILDLEDAVAPAAKDDARDKAAEAVKAGGFGDAELVIRINALDTPWGSADLAAAAAAGPDAILLPKISRAEDLATASGRLVEHDPAGAVALWSMMETAEGILNAQSIAAASPRLKAFVMGTNDLAKELRTRPTPDREPLLTSLSLVILAARSRGLAAIDGVFGDLDDADGLDRECRQGLALGFDGKTLIHPKQIDPTNAIFAPADDEVDSARRIIQGWSEQGGDEKGVITVDGRMVEALHVEQARYLVAMKDAIDARQG